MKKIAIAMLCALTLLLLSVVPMMASADNIRLVQDEAEVLTETEENELNSRLSSLREQYQFDLVIVTVTGVYNREEYADDYFDYNGYGYGKNHDGALLLVNINADGSYYTDNGWISTSGSGIKAFSDKDIQTIGDAITDDLLSGNYYGAFMSFADLSEKELAAVGRKSVLIIAGVALVVGLLGAVTYTNGLKKQLISVEQAVEANHYVVGGSLSVSQAYDQFLYRHITRREKTKNNGGSSTHTSSSGNTHGGGGF